MKENAYTTIEERIGILDICLADVRAKAVEAIRSKDPKLQAITATCGPAKLIMAIAQQIQEGMETLAKSMPREQLDELINATAERYRREKN